MSLNQLLLEECPSWTKLNCDSIEVKPETLLQLTSPVTAVAGVRSAGRITTQALSNAVNADVEFNFTNAKITVQSKILVSIEYDGAGAVLCNVKNIVPGQCTFKLKNADQAAALDDVCTIHYLILTPKA